MAHQIIFLGPKSDQKGATNTQVFNYVVIWMFHTVNSNYCELREKNIPQRSMTKIGNNFKDKGGGVCWHTIKINKNLEIKENFFINLY